MTDRPILFSAQMIVAMLAGRKTQTRRVLKMQPPVGLDAGFLHIEGEPGPRVTHGLVVLRDRFPYAVGDRLWVRESWKPHSTFAHMKPRDIPKSNVFFAADNAYAPSNTKWVPSIHMPRWASRLTLIVEDVKVERLTDISEADAQAEGVYHNGPCDHARLSCASIGCPGPRSFRDSFSDLWNALHGAGAWDSNPWVVAVTFRVVRGNIDAVAS